MTKAEKQHTDEAAERLDDASAIEAERTDTDDTGAGAGERIDEAEGGGAGDAGDSVLRRELATLNDRHLRLAAEFDNYRKRTERERREVSVRSQSELAGELLDALDDLERVVAVDAGTSSAETILEGVRLVERKLMRALESAGLERIDAAGAAFDPETMEALMTTSAESPEEDDRVDQVFQPGYRFKGHLLRPARVGVKQFEG